MNLSLFGLALTLASPATPADQAYRERFPLHGLAVNVGGPDLTDEDCRRAKAAGFKWIRKDFAWRWNEPDRKGEYNLWFPKRVVETAERNGMRLWIVLAYNNPLYALSEKSAVVTQANRDAYVRWVERLWKEYGNRGIVWEIWNEPDDIGNKFWLPNDPEATNYAALVNAVGRRRDALGLREYLAAPGTFRVNLPYIEQCFRLGILKYVDVVNPHGYANAAPEQLTGQFRRVQALIDKYRGDRPIVLACGEQSYMRWWLPKDRPEEEVRADYLVRSLEATHRAGVKLHVVYELYERNNDGMGLMTKSGMPTRAYRALADRGSIAWRW